MPEGFYNRTATLLRKTTTRNELGEFEETWSAVSTFLARLRTISGSEARVADRITRTASHRLYCDPVSISEADRVQVDGKTYEVVFVDDPHGLGHHLEIDLAEAIS